MNTKLIERWLITRHNLPRGFVFWKYAWYPKNSAIGKGITFTGTVGWPSRGGDMKTKRTFRVSREMARKIEQSLGLQEPTS